MADAPAMSDKPAVKPRRRRLTEIERGWKFMKTDPGVKRLYRDFDRWMDSVAKSKAFVESFLHLVHPETGLSYASLFAHHPHMKHEDVQSIVAHYLRYAQHPKIRLTGDMEVRFNFKDGFYYEYDKWILRLSTDDTPQGMILV